MNWQQITLGQFQDIYKLSKETDIDELDKISRAISIIYDLSEQQVDDLPLPKFNAMGKECAKFLSGDIPGKAVKSFRVGSKRFAINYAPQSLKHRQYVEILHFSDKPIDNMHYIMASLVQPIKWGFRRPNKAEDHASMSAFMIDAPFLAVYHSCVFFCKLYKNSIEAIRPYLIQEMTSQGMTKTDAEKLIAISINGMDGFIQQKRWPNMKA